MKFMNKKRFASAAMAGVMAMSLAAPAFAATTQPKNSTVITGAYEEIPISVVVPTTGQAKINPYGLPVVLTKSNDSTVNLINQQITHGVLAIRNQSDVALDVSVSSFGILPAGELGIGATKDGDKQIAVTLEVAGLDDAKYAVAPDSDSLGDALIDDFADASTWSGLTAANKVLAPTVTAGATTVTPAKSTGTVATLGAATIRDGEVTAYGNDSIALFRLNGDLTAEPKTGTTENPWETTDGFTATVVFKFTPAAAATYAVTIGTITGGTVTADNATAAAGATVTLTPTATTAGQTPTYTVYKTGDNTTTVTVTGNTFTMPAYPVTVDATFA